MGRSAVLAVIASVIAAYALGVVSVQHPEKNRSPNPDSSQSADAKRNYPSRSPGTARSPQSVSQVHRTESAQKGDQQHWSEKFIDHLPDWFVALFTAVLSLFTYRLYQATVGLQEATAGLLERAAEQASDMKASIDAARDAANAARAANELTREIFVAEQRPWVLWRLPKMVTISKAGRHLRIDIDGEIENIGKTPALNISYFGKFYSPGKGEAMLSQGIAYYSEHLLEALQNQFVLANLLPTEKDAIRFGTVVEIASLPTDQRFSLCLAFHAKYEFLVRLKQVAEIGSVYIIQPVGLPQKTDFHIDDFSIPKTAVLMEWPGVRRIT